MASLIDPEDLAYTYDPPTYADGWTAVLDYQSVMRYASKHPNKGSAAIASRLDMPRGRIRTWLDGGKPDAARGIETAKTNGWLPIEYGDTKFYALNVLVANVFSGGSITESTFAPSFALNYRDHDSHVVDALESADVEYEFFHEDDEHRSTEVRPTTDASVLGRVLAVLGAPIGPKREKTDLSLPWYLDDAPLLIRKRFVEAYLSNRAIHQRTKRTVTIQEDRPKTYRDELAALIDDVTDGDVTSKERAITISAEAVRSIGLERRYAETPA